MKNLFLAVLLAMLLPDHAFAQAKKGADPVGMVIDVQGGATAIESGKSARIEMLSYLRPQAEIELAAGASLAVTWYANSNEYRFKGPARLKVLPDKIEVLKGDKAQARSLGEDKVAAARHDVSGRIAQATMTMRALRPAQDPAIVSPGSRVMTLAPRFAWTSAKGASAYRFTLQKPAGEAIVQRNVKGTSLRLPADKRLEWGGRYRLSVQAEGASSSSPAEADFEVITREQSARLQKLRPKTGQAFSDWVLYALALESLNLSAEAKPVWKKLAADRPDDPTLQAFAK